MANFYYNTTTTGNCSNNSTGRIVISATTNANTNVIDYNSNPPYAIVWNNPSLGTDYFSNVSERDNLISGTYEVYLQKTFTPSTTTDEFIYINISNGVCNTISEIQNTTCSANNGSFKITTESTFTPVTYELYDSNGQLLSLQSGQPNFTTFDGLSAGTYYSISTDGGGCSATTENVVIEKSIDFDFGLYTIPNSNCDIVSTGKIIVTGQTFGEPYTYKWSNGQTGDTITGLTEGVYTVEVTNSLGCTKIKNGLIENSPPISLLEMVVTQPTCFSNDGVINLLISGGTPPYYYSASTGFVEISYSTNLVLTGLTLGTYNFEITDAGYCKFFTSTNLQSPNGISDLSIITTNSSCSSSDGKIQISTKGGVPPYTYSLIKPEGNTISETSSQTTVIFENLSTGTYTVVVQDQTSCSKSQEIYIFTDNKYTIDTVISASTIKNDGVINVIINSGGTPPFECIVDGSQKITAINIGSFYFYNIGPGQHEVSVIDFTGCVQKTQVFVPTLPTVDFYLKSTSSGNGNEGEITAFIINGTPPFTFNWSENIPNNPQEIKVTNLTAGTYSLSVVDKNKTIKSRTIEVSKVNKISSYETFGMGTQKLSVNTESNYNLIRMLNEGYQDITSGLTNCNLSSASFIAKVKVLPFEYELTNNFYTTNSIVDAPSDNLWYDTAKNLLMSIQGVGNVIIDELTNTFIIEADLENPSLIYGTNPINISLSLEIDYDINCD